MKYIIINNNNNNNNKKDPRGPRPTWATPWSIPDLKYSNEWHSHIHTNTHTYNLCEKCLGTNITMFICL